MELCGPPPLKGLARRWLDMPYCFHGSTAGLELDKHLLRMHKATYMQLQAHQLTRIHSLEGSFSATGLTR